MSGFRHSLEPKASASATVRIAVSRRFESGETVHSPSFGLGQVAAGGLSPVVLFMDGAKRTVSPQAIRPIPWEWFEAELINRVMIEAWLDLRLSGHVSREVYLLLCGRLISTRMPEGEEYASLD